ncbi:hypothetical protein BJD12_21485 [Xanthomonas vesicatoria ATCC 35937]|nr:hypothetical protein BJD12_21485 [Xanthomonas vesicatoria ATCC 35937]
MAQRGVFAFFSKNTSELSGVVSSPLVGPLAAWMPPSSPHGWVHGESRERRGHRALGQPGFCA